MAAAAADQPPPRARAAGRRPLQTLLLLAITLLAGTPHPSVPPPAAGVTEQATRRALLAGALAAAAAAEEEAEECRKCCRRDWCQCDPRKCDCVAVLSADGFKLPLEAPAAVAAAGRTGWPAALDWREANIPRWNAAGEEALRVGPSSIPEAGSGLFAASPLPKFSVLPPYQGTQLTAQEVRSRRNTGGILYTWCPLKGTEALKKNRSSTEDPDALSYCVDGRPALDGNPTRYINSAAEQGQCEAINVEICELGRVMYFRTTKPVPSGAELITDYGKNYWENFGGCGAAADTESRVIWKTLMNLKSSLR